MPGLAARDVKLRFGKGVLEVFGQRARKKKLFEDMFSRYYKIINLPEYLPTDQVFFLRFKRGVLKIVIDDDYIIHNKRQGRSSI